MHGMGFAWEEQQNPERAPEFPTVGAQSTPNGLNRLFQRTKRYSALKLIPVLNLSLRLEVAVGASISSIAVQAPCHEFQPAVHSADRHSSAPSDPFQPGFRDVAINV
jgi:hypothetical protein